jgi:putative copper export protein
LDETWRLIHLLAAAFWLGGVIFICERYAGRGGRHRAPLGAL